MKKHVLVSLLMAALLVSGLQMASAKNILVNAAGTDGAYTTWDAAVAAYVSGDNIYITDSSTYTASGTISPGGGSVIKGTLPVSPRIDCASNFCFGSDFTLENIKLVGPGSWSIAVLMTGTFHLYKLDISKFESGSPLRIDLPAGKVTTGTIKFVTTYDMSTGSGVICPNGTVGATADRVGPIVVDHCTLTYKGSGYTMMFGVDWPTLGEEFTVKNSIIGLIGQAAGVPKPDISGIFFKNDNGLGAGPNVVAHHNLYTDIWMFKAYDWNPTDGFHDTGIFPSAANGDIGAQWVKTQPFDDSVNPWNFNMKLKPYTSPALWKADDGLNMGADVNTVPVELSTFEIE